VRPKIQVVDFASTVLGLELYPEQKLMLEEYWGSDYNYGVFALGRRSGKTLMAQVSAVYAGTVMDPIYRQFLRKNETFRIIAVANSEDQSKIAIAGIQQLIMDSPFSHMIVRKREMSMTLENGVEFIGIPTSARAARGPACPLLIMDELAFAVGGSEVNAGGEAIYNALSPSMAQFGRYGKLFALSSPGIKAGIFYKLYEQSISLREDGEKEFPNMLGFRKATWTVNPRISRDFLAAEKKRDPVMFAVEYGANFISNAMGLVDSRIVDDSVDYSDTLGKPNDLYYGQYYLSLDPAKGNRDDYVACICHYQDQHLCVDLWHEFKATKKVLKRTSSGDEAVSQVDIKEVQAWIKSMHSRWGFATVVLDQYNSMETIQALQDYIDIREFIWSLSTKTKAYSKLRDLFNAGLVRICPNEKGIQQIKNLTVIHRPNGQWVVTGGDKAAVDDYCASLAANILMMESPEQDTDWLQALVA
jgi:hypothetical protein